MQNIKIQQEIVRYGNGENMLVMKFGGTSVGDAERIKTVAEIVKSALNKKPVVVCSAVAGVTNSLIAIENAGFKGESTKELQKQLREKHDKIISELGIKKDVIDSLWDELGKLMERVEAVKLATSETMDHIQSFGERMSCRIVAEYFNKIGIKSQCHDAYDVGMITSPDFGKAEPLEHAPHLIKSTIKKLTHVPVITGYIGKTTAGEITTLSRGGSDYTAAIIGAAIGSEEIQIWTDVDGVMSSDPKIVKNAKTIDTMSFNEAAELATFGAKVLHPKTIIPAVEKNIPVRVLNTHNPKGKGTLIVGEAKKTDSVVKAIACKKGIALINIISTRMLNQHGYLARIFEIFADHQKSVDMLSTSEVSVSLTVNEPDNMEKVVKDLSGIANVKLETGKAIICVVGEGMKYHPGMAGRIFTIIGKTGVNIEMISQGASEINISCVVNEEDAEKVVNALHNELIK
jgi:aspartate kinase